MKKKSKNKLDNGAIAKLASITSTAITTFKEKQKQKKKELMLKRKKEELSKLNIERKEINKKIDQHFINKCEITQDASNSIKTLCFMIIFHEEFENHGPSIKNHQI